MRIILTGSSGRIGRAIFNALAAHHQVVGVDRSAFATTHLIADFADSALLAKLVRGADAIIHTAALHAPQVGMLPDAEFHRINVEGTRLLIKAAQMAGVLRLVFTSTTALFGQPEEGRVAWVTDETIPKPRSIYHHTKLAAEALLQEAANPKLAVRVLRMGRCFPERADVVALHRLSRGIDARDVAEAHRAALTNGGPYYQRFIVSGKTPFLPEDCPLLATNLEAVLQKRAPEVIAAFQKRGWKLPASIDRVYVSTPAETSLGWTPRYGFQEVLDQLDRQSLEVLPVFASKEQREE